MDVILLKNVLKNLPIRGSIEDYYFILAKDFLNYKVSINLIHRMNGDLIKLDTPQNYFEIHLDSLINDIILNEYHIQYNLAFSEKHKKKEIIEYLHNRYQSFDQNLNTEFKQNIYYFVLDLNAVIITLDAEGNPQYPNPYLELGFMNSNSFNAHANSNGTFPHHLTDIYPKCLALSFMISHEENLSNKEQLFRVWSVLRNERNLRRDDYNIGEILRIILFDLNDYFVKNHLWCRFWLSVDFESPMYLEDVLSYVQAGFKIKGPETTFEKFLDKELPKPFLIMELETRDIRNILTRTPRGILLEATRLNQSKITTIAQNIQTHYRTTLVKSVLDNKILKEVYKWVVGSVGESGGGIIVGAKTDASKTVAYFLEKLKYYGRLNVSTPLSASMKGIVSSTDKLKHLIMYNSPGSMIWETPDKITKDKKFSNIPLVCDYITNMDVKHPYYILQTLNLEIPTPSSSAVAGQGGSTYITGTDKYSSALVLSNLEDSRTDIEFSLHTHPFFLAPTKFYNPPSTGDLTYLFRILGFVLNNPAVKTINAQLVFEVNYLYLYQIHPYWVKRFNKIRDDIASGILNIQTEKSKLDYICWLIERFLNYLIENKLDLEKYLFFFNNKTTINTLAKLANHVDFVDRIDALKPITDSEQIKNYYKSLFATEIDRNMPLVLVSKINYPFLADFIPIPIDSKLEIDISSTGPIILGNHMISTTNPSKKLAFHIKNMCYVHGTFNPINAHDLAFLEKTGGEILPCVGNELVLECISSEGTFYSVTNQNGSVTNQIRFNINKDFITPYAKKISFNKRLNIRDVYLVLLNRELSHCVSGSTENPLKRAHQALLSYFKDFGSTEINYLYPL